MIRVRNMPRSSLFQKLIVGVIVVSLLSVLLLRSPLRSQANLPITSAPSKPAKKDKPKKVTQEETKTVKETVKETYGVLKRVCIHEKLLHIRFSEFAEIAKSEGLKDLAHIFADISNNEKAHHSIFEKALGQQCNASRANKTSTGSAENLKWAIDIKLDRIETYPTYAKIAEEEGLTDVQNLFLQITAIEQQHLDQLKEIEQKAFASQKWVCQNCGYVHTGSSEPKECPLCRTTKFAAKE